MFIAKSYYFSPKNQTQRMYIIGINIAHAQIYNDNASEIPELHRRRNKVFLFDIWLDLGGN